MTSLGRHIIGKNLLALRKAKGMSQEDVAGAAQIDRSYISQVENERYSISIDQIEKLADVFGVAIHDMLHPDTASRFEETARK